MSQGPAGQASLVPSPQCVCRGLTYGSATNLPQPLASPLGNHRHIGAGLCPAIRQSTLPALHRRTPSRGLAAG